MIWQCPHCNLSLGLEGRSWRCANGHTFDQAREGYVNLLPVQQKRSREPGDSPEMLNARRRFLEAGHYAPLADAICAQLMLVREQLQTPVLLDVGCGEGYYDRALVQAGWPEPGVTGVDIAKAGVRLAAKRLAQAQFAVGSSFHLPVADSSVDAILRVFAPGPAEELLRVLKPGGILLDVSPGPDHLWSLKSRLYENPQQHTAPAPVAGFTLESELRCEFPLAIKGGEPVQDFLAMTPFAWKGDAEARRTLEEEPSLNLEADFLLRRYVKPVH
ncbi:23S rRNA methyltransferase [Microbulbifer agarilyticus]|uniref:23S rRNA methyltransferase n=1 Tax=Microbulbifer agarilyticus TaxID=260552 RepID=A0A1Q2M6T9_9GAMM|nr:methyltransferase domain-containing protein [Microbulbifer agarilyticus]AQQ68396.1 23S rRNA methyltransferase [Microbulbifer agarilyticus]